MKGKQNVNFRAKRIGLSLEQLDYLYNNNVPTRQFKTYHFADDILASDTVETIVDSADNEKGFDGHDGDEKK